MKLMTYFPNSIYWDPYRPLPSHLYSKIPVIKGKRVEFSLFLLYNASHYSTHTEVFKREIQSDVMVTPSPGMIFNQHLQFLVWNYAKRKIHHKNLHICCCIRYSTCCWTYLWGWFLFDEYSCCLCFWINQIFIKVSSDNKNNMKPLSVVEVYTTKLSHILF